MSLIIKVVLYSLFLLIFFSLSSALYYLVTDRSGSTRTIKALTWRIVLSIILFAVVMIAYMFGLIQPHPIMMLKG